jgi:hypothetical protein
MQVRESAMVVASKIVLPYEPQYVGHRDAEERRRAVSEWLRQRERQVDEHNAPSVVPEQPSTSEQSFTGKPPQPGRKPEGAAS